MGASLYKIGADAFMRGTHLFTKEELCDSKKKGGNINALLKQAVREYFSDIQGFYQQNQRLNIDDSDEAAVYKDGESIYFTVNKPQGTTLQNFIREYSTRTGMPLSLESSSHDKGIVKVPLDMVSSYKPEIFGLIREAEERQAAPLAQQQAEDEIPEDLQDPLTGDIYQDPVRAADGQTYSRSFIEEWFRRGHRTSPLHGNELPNLSLTPDTGVQRRLVEYAQRQIAVTSVQQEQPVVRAPDPTTRMRLVDDLPPVQRQQPQRRITNDFDDDNTRIAIAESLLPVQQQSVEQEQPVVRAPDPTTHMRLVDDLPPVQRQQPQRPGERRLGSPSGLPAEPNRQQMRQIHLNYFGRPHVATVPVDALRVSERRNSQIVTELQETERAREQLLHQEQEIIDPREIQRLRDVRRELETRITGLEQELRQNKLAARKTIDLALSKMLDERRLRNEQKDYYQQRESVAKRNWKTKKQELSETRKHLKSTRTKNAKLKWKLAYNYATQKRDKKVQFDQRVALINEIKGLQDAREKDTKALRDKQRYFEGELDKREEFMNDIQNELGDLKGELIRKEKELKKQMILVGSSNEEVTKLKKEVETLEQNLGDLQRVYDDLVRDTELEKKTKKQTPTNSITMWLEGFQKKVNPGKYTGIVVAILVLGLLAVLVYLYGKKVYDYFYKQSNIKMREEKRLMKGINYTGPYENMSLKVITEDILNKYSFVNALIFFSPDGRQRMKEGVLKALILYDTNEFMVHNKTKKNQR
jgi:archaellum component FlaC